MTRRDYNIRFYRDWVNTPDLTGFQVKIKETDLQVRARADLTTETRQLVLHVRRDIETYASVHPDFLTSFSPMPRDDHAPPVVQAMLDAGIQYGVGPLAAVAGAIAEEVGRQLLTKSPEIIVENGGDIFLHMSRPVTLRLYCGEDSPFAGKVLVRLDPKGESRGICTSSATVGPSASFGAVDAAVTIARSAALADAAATAIGNRIRAAADLRDVLQQEQDRGTLLGCLVVLGKHLAAWGDIEITT